MSAHIGSFLNDAIEKINRNDFEMAAASVSMAVAGTAKKAFPHERKDAKKYKDFLNRHMGLIMFVAMPGLAIKKGTSVRLGFDHPNVPKDGQGYCTLEDILYHVVRCGLFHEAVFPTEVKFGDSLSADGNLPKGLLHGLILAVIVAPENTDESLPQNWVQDIKGTAVTLNDYWGKEQELVHFLGLKWLET
jgi:hypothetical protein